MTQLGAPASTQANKQTSTSANTLNTCVLRLCCQCFFFNMGLVHCNPRWDHENISFVLRAIESCTHDQIVKMVNSTNCIVKTLLF